MRLLLDEHYSAELARQLRDRGHDVLAVVERPDLRGRADYVHFAAVAGERRAIVTEDVADFRPLLAEAILAGAVNYGLICVPARRFPRARQTVGRVIAALDALLVEHPGDDALRDREIWLA